MGDSGWWSVSEPFELIILDTYDVTFLRSPRYLEDPLVEAVDAQSRDLVEEGRFWVRLAREMRPATLDVEDVLDRLADRFCKNLNVWKELPGWSSRMRLVLLHGGPAGLLGRWRARHDLDRFFAGAAAAGSLGLSRADPALYARLAADAGIPPDRCLLVDDERAPFEAARAAGLAAYRFGTVFGLKEALRAGAGHGT
jgi:FMN phosphatase YigB (HAD superfamily)